MPHTLAMHPPGGPAAGNGTEHRVSAVAKRPARLVRDGRELLSRAELARVSGERAHTIYKWWVERDRNGHPDVVTVDVAGQQLPYFDVAVWRAWRAAHGADRRLIGGRPHVTPAALAADTGEPLANLNHWYLHRDRNGHPPATILDRRRYVDLEHWRHWYDRHLAERRAGLTAIDRSGDPDELITAAEAARILHIGYSTLTSYISHGQFIEPDTDQTLPSGRGHRRRWRRRRVWAFAEARSWSRRSSTPTDHHPA